MTSSIEDHADKYNDPRAQISRRGILIGLCVLVFGIGGAAFSIWARRTHLERSTQFWGPQVIQAFQLAEEVELIPMPDGSESPGSPESQIPSQSEVQPVRLSGMPGLGHLRHVLLDDRSYDWDSVQNEAISPQMGHSECSTLRFSDPSAKRFPDANIVIDLANGWIGMKEGKQKVRLNDRFRNALPTFLKRIENYEPIRVEMRAKKDAGG